MGTQNQKVQKARDIGRDAHEYDYLNNSFQESVVSLSKVGLFIF